MFYLHHLNFSCLLQQRTFCLMAPCWSSDHFAALDRCCSQSFTADPAFRAATTACANSSTGATGFEARPLEREAGCVPGAFACRWTSECFSASMRPVSDSARSRVRRSEEPVAKSSKENKQMSVLRAVTASVFSLGLLGVVVTPEAKADEWNRKTVITFSGPVEIPGVHLTGWGVLPAGTYVFKILDSQSDRHIVQIFNKDETEIYATILAIPNYRLRATDKTVITFRERPAGEPEALRAWFYPGRTGARNSSIRRRRRSRWPRPPNARPFHSGRDSSRSGRADQVGGRASRDGIQTGANYGDQADWRRGATGRGGYSAAGAARSGRC